MQIEEVALSFQESCLGRRANEALSHVPVACEKSWTDSLKTLKKKFELMKEASNALRWSKQGRPISLPRFGEESVGYIFAEEVLALAPFAKSYSPGPEDP